ncbi:MAG: hypothetical protein K1X94_23850 [Sandaracinaceae bacterium]|nr:hypothetical protein [Sandaracinaceae bacterium]
MPYRHDDARERERTELASQLAALRNEPRTPERTDREHQLLERIRALGLTRRSRGLPTLALLPRLRIASPCGEDWNAMVGNERVRHCSRCEKDVFDLSAMTSHEVLSLLRAHDTLPEGGLPCVRFYRRSDGTILTSDCVAGSPRRVGPVAAAGVALASAMALAGAISPEDPPHTSAAPYDGPRLAPSTGDLLPLAPIEEVAFGEPIYEDPYEARSLLGGDGLDPAVAEPSIEPAEAGAGRSRGR